MRRYSIWHTIVIGALLATGQAMAEGDAAAGEALSATCVACHGANGEGMDPNPPIAGLDVETFITSMNAYKSGENAEPMMAMMAAPLSDEDIANLAAYYASLSSGE
jgi:cytochrome c553